MQKHAMSKDQHREGESGVDNSFFPDCLDELYTVSR